jgi:uncharacterized protein YdeI (YjbR/CyaY-like superfamily)
VTAKFFATSRAFRAWLEKNHDRADELVVGFYKRDSGKKSITWPESVDQALCFGWIDGVRKRIDDISYTIRFTPRRRGSIWSAVNIKRVEELKKLGLMTEAGLRAFAARDEKKSRIYAYEKEAADFPPEFETRFRANAAAWKFFNEQAPWYRRTITYWVVSAKREETRLKRLATLIEACEQAKRLR